jgi:hypothetical protein
MAQEDKPFTLHGEFRFRGETVENATDFDDDDSFDAVGFWPYRVRIAAEGKFGKNVGVWIEFQNTGVAGATDFVGTSPFSPPFRDGVDSIGLQGDGAELYQANISIDRLWSDNFGVRIGRQEIVAGNELHLGDLDFYSGISHDGLVGKWDFKKWNLMIFYTVVEEGDVSSFDANLPPVFHDFFGASGDTVQFYGGYWTLDAGKNHHVEAYILNLKQANIGFDVKTVGGRWASKTKGDGLFWNLEGAIQTGDVMEAAGFDAGGQVIEGWIGYAFNKAHSIYGKYASASGDDPSSADEDEGFMSLFGDFHNRLGRGDWFILDDSQDFGNVLGGGGIDAISVGYKFHPNDKHSLGAAYWSYSVNESAGAPDAIGTAIDVWYDHNYNKNLAFSIALSRFDPDDDYVFDGDAAQRLYGQARLRF